VPGVPGGVDSGFSIGAGAGEAYFVSKYGEWILLKPRLRGINLVVYVAPFVVILGGGAIIALAVRKWIRTSTCENPNSAGVG
jgi:cytochrome c-type biogenesis protein CcmH/NrfF